MQTKELIDEKQNLLFSFSPMHFFGKTKTYLNSSPNSSPNKATFVSFNRGRTSNSFWGPHPFYL